jgi:transcriptional regulator with XRE-family HTH domain
VTQEVLASQVGLTRSSITNIEAGRQRIQLHVFLEIAAALDVPPERLLPRLSRSRSEDFMADLDEHLEGQPDSTHDFVRKALRKLPAGEYQ